MKSILICFVGLAFSDFGVFTWPENVSGNKTCPPCVIFQKIDPQCVEYDGSVDLLVNAGATKCAIECGIGIKQVELSKCDHIIKELGLEDWENMDSEELYQMLFHFTTEADVTTEEVES